MAFVLLSSDIPASWVGDANTRYHQLRSLGLADVTYLQYVVASAIFALSWYAMRVVQSLVGGPPALFGVRLDNIHQLNYWSHTGELQKITAASCGRKCTMRFAFRYHQAQGEIK